MAYLGSPPASQFFAPGTDTFSGTDSQTAFTLSRNVATVNDIQVVVNNVVQQPSNYTVASNILTFSPAPSSGTNNIYVRYLSTNLQSIVPQQGSVTPASLSTGGPTWNTSGNLGIGISPAYKLDVLTSATTRFGVVTSSGGNLIGSVNETNTSYKNLQIAALATNFSYGDVLVTSTFGIGYGTGAGGTVTQTTNKNTGVTLNRPSGQIITSNSALPANATAGFQLNSSLITSTDVVVLSINSPNTGTYQTWVYFTTNGYCFVALKNNSGSSLSEAVTINFVVIKSVTS
jgi:hypothetical protein